MGSVMQTQNPKALLLISGNLNHDFVLYFNHQSITSSTRDKRGELRRNIGDVKDIYRRNGEV